MSQYTLPDLSYDYDALEPQISGRIMELHHSKHHAGYVKNVNAVLERLDEARARNDYERLAGLERTLAFNLSGHVLHSIFWRNLSPDGGGEPGGEFARALIRDFESFGAFKQHMTQAAATIMGSGWAALVWEPIGRMLLVTQIYDHQSNLAQAGVPLMVLDAWEHAYYLQYQSRKIEFFEGIWNRWNWRDITLRWEQAMKLDVGLEKASR